MDPVRTAEGYSEGDILRWLDQAKALLEQTLARITSVEGKLNAPDRQAVTDNLVLIANVVTHLGRHVLHAQGGGAPEEPGDGGVLPNNPAFLSRLTEIHNRMQAVYQRLQAASAPLN